MQVEARHLLELERADAARDAPRGLLRRVLRWLASLARLLWLLALFTPVALGAPPALAGSRPELRRWWMRLFRQAPRAVTCALHWEELFL